MAKRRTKKQKARARHNFELTWSAGTKKANTGTSVKGQKNNAKKGKRDSGTTSKSAQPKEEMETNVQIKRDIGKSLGLASLVLGIELVIYFVS